MDERRVTYMALSETREHRTRVMSTSPRHRRHRIGTVGTVDPGHRVTPGSCGIPSPVIHPLAFPDVALARSPNNRAKYSPASSLAYA